MENKIKNIVIIDDGDLSTTANEKIREIFFEYNIDIIETSFDALSRILTNHFSLIIISNTFSENKISANDLLSTCVSTGKPAIVVINEFCNDSICKNHCTNIYKEDRFENYIHIITEWDNENTSQLRALAEKTVDINEIQQRIMTALNK